MGFLTFITLDIYHDLFEMFQRSADCVGTNESIRNSYAPAKELKRQPEGKRIDYIMFKSDPSVQVNLEYKIK